MDVKVVKEAWTSNLNFATRVNFIATLASISYGNDHAKNPYKLVKALYSRGHQSLFEFIRCPHVNIKGHLQGYKIQDSLRHDHSIPTIEAASALYGFDKDELISCWKQSLVCLRIETPIFVDRQLVRHRSDSRIEMSRRYVKPEKVKFSYWFPESYDDLAKATLEEEYNNKYQRNMQEFKRAELARFDQPLNMYTYYYVMRDVDGARNFYVRRFNKHAQKETRELVRKELEVIQKVQPEFLGIRVFVVDANYSSLPILELQKFGKENGFKKLTIEYGDPHYYGVFDVESGLFEDDIPKFNDFENMFGTEDDYLDSKR